MSERVVVVGGGIVGLSSAYFLRRAGFDVLVLETGRTGQGASKGNAGWVAARRAIPVPGPGVMAQGLRSLLRPESPLYFRPSAMPTLAPWLLKFAKHCNGAARRRGIAAMTLLSERVLPAYEQICRDGVGVKLLGPGLLFCLLDERQMEAARGQVGATGPRDRTPPEVLDAAAMRQLEPALSSSVVGGFLAKDERYVDPEGLTAALHRAAAAIGVEIREGERVIGFECGPAAVRSVTSGTGQHRADRVVIAAGAVSGDLLRILGVGLPLQAAKGYSFAARPTPLPTHSLYLFEAKVAVSPLGDHLRLAGTLEFGGVNSRCDGGRLAGMARSAGAYFNDGLPVRSHEWVGMRPILPDGMPAIGRLRRFPNVLVATGHANLGITLGPATGELVAHEITTGQALSGFEVFSPSRFGA